MWHFTPRGKDAAAVIGAAGLHVEATLLSRQDNPIGL